MVFAGEIVLEKPFFTGNNPEQNFDKHLSFDCGFIGLDNFDRAGYYLIGYNSKEKGAQILSNSNVQNLAPFSLENYLRSTDASLVALVALYDADLEEISFYREPFARVPLYYMLDGKRLAFSSDLRLLLENKRFPKRFELNEPRIASYSDALADSARFYSIDTFYKNIRTVLPGHSLTINIRSEQCRTEPHTFYRPSKWNHILTVEEFGEEIRARFRNSVATQLASNPFLAAAHLSGGLDSSSVSAMAKYVRPGETLHTLYNKSNTLDTSENLYAREVADHIGSIHHEVVKSDNDFDSMRKFIEVLGEPVAALISASSTNFMMPIAKSLGCGIILDGRDGDSVVGSALESINLMFEERNWDALRDLLGKRVAHYSLAYQYPGWESFSNHRKYQIVLQNFLFKRLASKRHLPTSQFLKLLSEVSAHFPISYSFVFKKLSKGFLNRIKNKRFDPIQTILQGDLASRRIKPTDELLSMLEEDHSPAHRQSLRDVYNAQSFFAGEQNFALSNYYGIVNASPFYHKDLFELCMAVPDSMKFGDGIGRAHFREAMRGILPDNVRCRSTKTPIRGHGQELVTRLHNHAEELIQDSRELWYYVDRKKYEAQVAILKNDKIPYTHKGSTWFHISRTVSLAIWFDWLNRQKKSTTI